MNLNKNNKMTLILFLTICISVLTLVLIFSCTPINTKNTHINLMSNHRNNCLLECSTPKRSQACIQTVISCEAQNLKRTYENALKRDNSINGKLLVKFIINPNGSTSIKECTVNTVNDSLFVRNVLEEIELWKFPETDSQAIEVVYPFVFEGATTK